METLKTPGTRLPFHYSNGHLTVALEDGRYLLIVAGPDTLVAPPKSVWVQTVEERGEMANMLFEAFLAGTTLDCFAAPE